MYLFESYEFKKLGTDCPFFEVTNQQNSRCWIYTRRNSD